MVVRMMMRVAGRELLAAAGQRTGTGQTRVHVRQTEIGRVQTAGAAGAAVQVRRAQIG